MLCFVANFMKSQAEMPQKELTIAERVVVLRKIRERPPNISHRQLAEITGVPRTTWHRYCKTSVNRVSRLIGPNGAYPRCDSIKRNLLYNFYKF